MRGRSNVSSLLVRRLLSLTTWRSNSVDAGNHYGALRLGLSDLCRRNGRLTDVELH